MVPGRYICSKQLCGNPLRIQPDQRCPHECRHDREPGGVDEGGTLETGGWKNHFVYS